VTPSGTPRTFEITSGRADSRLVQVVPIPRARIASINDQAAGRIEPKKPT
ncbi:uncharacterized protein METZ01_LOCUS87402, partial [marine metagenome]